MQPIDVVTDCVGSSAIMLGLVYCTRYFTVMAYMFIIALLLQLFYRKSISSATSTERFDKSLEEFYAICDQVELNLVSNCFFGINEKQTWQLRMIYIQCLLVELSHFLSAFVTNEEAKTNW